MRSGARWALSPWHCLWAQLMKCYSGYCRPSVRTARVEGRPRAPRLLSPLPVLVESQVKHSTVERERFNASPLNEQLIVNHPKPSIDH